MSKESETIQRLETRVAELQDDLTKTRERLIQLMDKVTTSNEQSTSPLNTDSADFDVLLNKQIEDRTIKKGVISRTYWGRVVSVRLMGNDTIVFSTRNHHLEQKATERNPYIPLQIAFSAESFLLALDTMKYAEEKLGIDRKAVVDKLTGGGEFRFEEAIVDI